MADNNILLTNATETTENNSKKDFNKSSSNPNDSAFMLDELLMMREFADEE